MFNGGIVCPDRAQMQLVLARTFWAGDLSRSSGGEKFLARVGNATVCLRSLSRRLRPATLPMALYSKKSSGGVGSWAVPRFSRRVMLFEGSDPDVQ